MGSYVKKRYRQRKLFTEITGEPRIAKRSPETIAKWKASLHSTAKLNEKPLTDEQRHFVCRLIAEFERPLEIKKRLMEIYEADISVTDVYYFSSSKKWQPVINHYRTQYSKMMNHIPLFHKRQRLERLESQYQEIEKLGDRSKKTAKEKRSEQRAVLRQALEECQVWEKKDGNTTNYVSIQYNAMDDSDLLKKRDELVSRISKYKEIPHGETVQGDPSGRGREGIQGSQNKPVIDAQWEAEQASRERLAGLESP